MLYIRLWFGTVLEIWRLFWIDIFFSTGNLVQWTENRFSGVYGGDYPWIVTILTVKPHTRWPLLRHHHNTIRHNQLFTHTHISTTIINNTWPSIFIQHTKIYTLLTTYMIGLNAHPHTIEYNIPICIIHYQIPYECIQYII